MTRYGCAAAIAYNDQSSNTRSGTRLNARALFVTSVQPVAMAWPAMAVSFWPIAVHESGHSAISGSHR